MTIGEPFGQALFGLKALDLFAGTGWGVACQRLGIEEHGVELMPEAIVSREAAGMRTIYRDVWEGLDIPSDVIEAYENVPSTGPRYGHYDLLIASPPCQTFSMAGGGAGRRALDEVLGLIRSGLFRHPHELRAFGERHDPRTALVLTPLAHVARDTPRLVVFEQVPTVLPVWEACAEVMRGWGYSVVTGNLQAEQYGVPQTRKRAILIARWDGEARMPTPTHSRYYPHDPKRLDPGVLPWVSMADALGWGRTLRPSVTVTGGGTETGGAEPLAKLAREVAASDWVGREYMTANDRLSNAARRHIDLPAPTITAGHDSGNRKWTSDRPSPTVVTSRRAEGGMLIGRQLGDGDDRRDIGGHVGGGGLKPGQLPGVRVTPEEAAVLQSYPADFPFQGTKTKRFLQIGNAVPPKLAEAILSTLLD